MQEFSIEEEWYTVAFHQAGVELFEQNEWVQFFTLYREVAPRVFPDATLSITRHPAEFTHLDDIETIARALGEEIPAEVLQQLGDR
ncbi:MAG: hypothetical protein AAGH76_10220 [Pseudomonadota bacterium]